MKNVQRLSVVALATGAVAIAAAGTGYAFWSANGSGSGAAKSVEARTITVTAVAFAASEVGDLYPGGTGAVRYTLSNDNAYNTSFTKLTSASVVSDDTANCPNANIMITPSIASQLSGGYALAAAQAANAGGAPSGTYTIPNLLTMASSAPDGCQGRTFTVTLTLTGAQV